jgi:hypothetical protein
MGSDDVEGRHTAQQRTVPMYQLIAVILHILC